MFKPKWMLTLVLPPGFFPPANAPGALLRFKGVRPATVLTAAGEMVLHRRYFWGKGAGGRYPSDERAGIASGTVSPGAREVCCVMAMASDFRSASVNLARVGGLRICRERLRQIVEREAMQITAARDAGLLPAEGFGAALEKSRMYLGVDGLFVRTVTDQEKNKRRKSHAMRRRQRGKAGIDNLKPLPPVRAGTDQTFKEVKFALFYDQSKQHRHGLATAGDAAEAGRLLRLHAAAVGLDKARHKIGLTDGAPWIKRQLGLNLPMLTKHLLDFYHLAQHVHEAARVCLGEGSPEAETWAQARLDEARRAGPTTLLGQIDVLNKTLRAAAKRQAAGRLRGYVSERMDMLNYPSARRKGWDIGSGPTEAAGKAMALRVRGVGMKWDLDHAADMMNLKALYNSNQSKAWWSRAAGCLN